MSPHAASTLIHDVLTFWFGPRDEPRVSRKEWFIKNPAFDGEIKERFEGPMKDAAQGALGELMQSAEGSLTLAILLDQFPRNVYRGDAKAFATDAKARVIAKQAIDQHFDKDLDPIERAFLYLPIEHSEAMIDQDRSVELFTALGLGSMTDYAHQHRDVIKKFGRFPGRNKALGRESTPEEEAHLATSGGF